MRTVWEDITGSCHSGKTDIVHGNATLTVIGNSDRVIYIISLTREVYRCVTAPLPGRALLSREILPRCWGVKRVM